MYRREKKKSSTIIQAKHHKHFVTGKRRIIFWAMLQKRTTCLQSLFTETEILPFFFSVFDNEVKLTAIDTFRKSNPIFLILFITLDFRQKEKAVGTLAIIFTYNF